MLKTRVIADRSCGFEDCLQVFIIVRQQNVLDVANQTSERYMGLGFFFKQSSKLYLQSFVVYTASAQLNLSFELLRQVLVFLGKFDQFFVSSFDTF